MKKRKTLRNLAAALGSFLLWGSLISLLLPAAELGAAVKTIEFAVFLFLPGVLVAAAGEIARERAGNEERDTNGAEDA